MTLAPMLPEQLDFERLASQIWRGAAEKLSGDARLLASVSPLSVRVPDSRLVWHPGLRARSRGVLVRSLLGEAFGAVARGASKLLRGGVRFEVASMGTPGGGVLVMPSALGSVDADGCFHTSYVKLDPAREALVFGSVGSCGAGATPMLVGAGELVFLAVRLKRAGLSAAARAKGPVGDRFLLLLEWLVWVAALRFAHDLALSRALDARFSCGDVSTVGCVHEMNSIGRTVWAVAAKHGIAGRALQHAEITSGKRWYFPLPEELDAGVALPDEMVVYDSRLAEELAPFLPGVRFRLGCSARYAFWRGVAPRSSVAGGVVLFVGALARFDNDVVLASLMRVANAQPSSPLVVRLHPAAEVPPACARALARLEAVGTVEVSHGVSLADDLARASVVVGMSTTVLEEALLVGRPVIQLVDDTYLTYIELADVAGATRMPHAALDAAVLARAAATSPETIAVGAAEITRRLGLANPVVTHAMLLDSQTVLLADATVTT